jgi:hypothetical protein
MRSRRTRAAPARACAPGFLGLLDHQLRVGERRDLREVRHHQDLASCGESFQAFPNRKGGGSPDPSVDLIEHQYRDGVRGAQHALEGEHDARHLPTGCDPRERARRLAGRGCVEELHALRPVGCPRLAGEWRQPDLEAGMRH